MRRLLSYIAIVSVLVVVGSWFGIVGMSALVLLSSFLFVVLLVVVVDDLLDRLRG